MVKKALVPFLHYYILECDCNGQQYTIEDHDITLIIPERAVPEGKKVHFEIGVAMYGPFNFPESTRPISPIIWLCLLEDAELKKPFQLIVPHFLTQISEERVCYHQVGFAKANHDDYTSDSSQIAYNFHDCNTKPLLASIHGRSYGVLVSHHFCFYCLKANQTADLAMDAGYCLVRIETFLTPQRNEVHFCAIFLLKTCLRVSCYRCTVKKYETCFFKTILEFGRAISK